MDEELRKAQRAFQRAFGNDEIGIMSLYYEQVRDYLRQQNLSLVFGGVARDIWHLKETYPEMTPCRNMASRAVHFIHYAELDAKSPEQILKECCCHASWADWFDLVAYHQAFSSKNPGSCIWSQVLATPGNKATDGTTYQSRLQASFDEWHHFAIVCLLEPKYVPSGKEPERWHNWTAQLILVGYSKAS